MARYYVKYQRTPLNERGYGFVDLEPDRIHSAADVRSEIARQFQLKGSGADLTILLMNRMISGHFYVTFTADDRVLSILAAVNMNTIRSVTDLHSAIKAQYNEIDWLKIHPSSFISITALSYIGAL